MTENPKRPRGRPAEKPLPDPIDGTPEDIALAIMQGKPKDDWRYLKPDAANN